MGGGSGGGGIGLGAGGGPSNPFGGAGPPGVSPFGPMSSAFGASLGGNYGEFDVNAWASPTELTLYEAFREDKEESLHHHQHNLVS
jgi:hypothetical protein